MVFSLTEYEIEDRSGPGAGTGRGGKDGRADWRDDCRGEEETK